jgi:hypothetical protein
MESQILISKNIIRTHENLIIKICCYDSILIISLNFVNNDEYYYSYIGTLESLCLINGIIHDFTYSSFINGCKNTNYLDISGNVATFKFPIHIFNVNLPVSCCKKYFNKNVDSIMVNEEEPFKTSLESKMVEINEKINRLEILINDYTELKPKRHDLNPIDGSIIKKN